MKNKEKDKNCHKDHRQRMRSKIKANGFASLEDHEKLEVLMYYTIARANTNEQGHRLLERFGSFSAVLDAPIEELEKVEGVGPSTADFFNLLPQIVGCYISDKSAIVGEFNSIDDIGRYLTTKFYGCKVEKLYALALNSKNKIIDEKELSSGGSSLVNVEMRKIAGFALTEGCRSIVLAHNHPDGICIPSGDDIDMSKKIRNYLRELRVNVVQSFVIVNESFCSCLE